jgi:hypothetical protein
MSGYRLPSPQFPLTPTFWEDWVLQAECRKYGRSLGAYDPWFTEGRGRRGQYDEAREICNSCPVRRKCLESALQEERGQRAVARQGMRGAKTPEERYKIERARSSRVAS